MATGDIYRADVGTQTAGDADLNPASLTKVAFEDEIETAGIYSMDAGNDDLTVSEAGHYLITWALYGISTANGRQQVRGAVMINGSEITGQYGSNSGYERNNSNNKVAPTGIAIVELSADDIISIGAIRTATTATSIPQSDNEGGFTVTKLSDSASYARIRGGNSQTLSTTSLSYSDLQIATNDELGSGFTHATNSADITLADAGLYLVCYGWQATNNATTRLAMLSRLTLDGVIQHTTWSGRISRWDSGAVTQQMCAFALIRASASDILRISGANEKNDSGSATDVDNVWINIMRLESDIDVLIQPVVSGTQEANPASATVIDYDAPTEIDSGTFAETGGRITVQKTGHYLLSCNLHILTTDGGNTRIMPRIRPRLNTTPSSYAGGGGYNRGNQSTDFTLHSAVSGSFLTGDLAVDDIIDFTIQQDSEAVTGSRDIIEGGQTCFRIEDIAGASILQLVDETVNIVEQINEHVITQILQIINETININEESLRNLGLVRLTDETININEDTLKALGFIKQIDETVQIPESKFWVLLDGVVDISETVVNVVSEGGFVKVVNETVNVIEEELRNLGLSRIANETEYIAEHKDVLKYDRISATPTGDIDISAGDNAGFLLLGTQEEFSKFSISLKTPDSATGDIIGKIKINAGALLSTSNETLDIPTVLSSSYQIITFTFPSYIPVAGNVELIVEKVGGSGTVDLEIADDTFPVFFVKNGSANLAISCRGQIFERETNIVKVLGLSRIIDETEDVQEEVLRNLGLVRLTDETVNIPEAVQHIAGIIAQVNETVNIIEAKVTILGFVKIADETVNVSEEIIELAGIIEIVNETLNINEQSLRNLGLVRQVDETENILENILDLRGRIQVVDETVNVIEDVINLRGLVRQIDETINITEDQLNILGFIHIANETVQISEDQNIAGGFVKIHDETVNIAEGAIALTGILQIINETENISEQTNTALGLVKFINEQQNINEDTIRTLGLIKLVNETVQVAEDTVRALGLVRIKDETVQINEDTKDVKGIVAKIDETINIIEDTVTAIGFVKQVNETINITEDTIALTGIIQQINETIEISDESLRNLGLVRLEDETVNIVENIVDILGGNLKKVINENVNINEGTIKLAGLVRLIDEQQNITEDTVRALGLVKIIDETINILENIQDVTGIIEIVNETENILDDSVRALGKVRLILETVNINEEILDLTGILQIVDEDISIPENITKLSGLVRILNETETISEDTLKALGLVKTVDETEQIQEGTIASRGLVRIKNETENIIEGIVDKVVLTNIVAVVNETVNIAEDTIKALQFGFVKIVNEGVDVQEQVDKARGIVRNIIEEIQTSEETIRTRGLVKIVNEIENISESINNALGLIKVQNETVQIPEFTLGLPFIIQRLAQSIAKLGNTMRTSLKLMFNPALKPTRSKLGNTDRTTISLLSDVEAIVAKLGNTDTTSLKTKDDD
jgi:ribosomal protein L30/L7E